VQRWTELDAARGLLLVWMALAHLPTSLTVYSNQPFGFISAAEGFILISALFSGRNYLRLADREGFRKMRQKAGLRGWKLYRYHAATFRSSLRRLAIFPLVEMGQASLQVFCVHLLFCFAALMLMGDSPVVSGWTEAGLMLLTIAAMAGTGRFFASKQRGAKGPKGKSLPRPEAGKKPST
jgi:hypothetical protein